MIIFTLIIPIFQTPNILNLFLDSLYSTLEYKTQIIFINDNSGYEIQKILEDKAQNPDTLLINHEVSKGCVESINEGFQEIQGKYTVLLDSVGAFGSVLLLPQTGGVQNCGLAFSECMIRHYGFLGKTIWLPKDKYVKMQSTVFAFCCILTDVIKEVGFLDTDFLMEMKM